MISDILMNGPAIIDGVQLIVTGLLALAAFTPTDTDDKVLGRIKNLLDLVRFRKTIGG